MNKILQELAAERSRQNAKFGEQNHNMVEWVAILTEEVGEVAKEAVDYHFQYPEVNSNPKNELGFTQEQRLRNYRKECIQVAAVAVQMVESLDRQLKKA